MAREETRAEAVPQILANPQISLVGDIDKFAVERFLDQLRNAERSGGDIALEITTLGGDAELARRIVLEVGLAQARIDGRFYFLGKTIVYSAGVTIMCGFERENRWLAHDAMLMIHGRKLEKTVEISGPMRASMAQIEALRRQMEVGLEIEDETFRRLIKGSDVSFDEVAEKARYNWYLSAREALDRRLVAGIWSPA